MFCTNEKKYCSKVLKRRTKERTILTIVRLIGTDVRTIRSEVRMHRTSERMLATKERAKHTLFDIKGISAKLRLMRDNYDSANLVMSHL